jgi:hypothetical protein
VAEAGWRSGEVSILFERQQGWFFSDREDMETGKPTGCMHIVSAAPTPDQTPTSALAWVLLSAPPIPAPVTRLVLCSLGQLPL